MVPETKPPGSNNTTTHPEMRGEDGHLHRDWIERLITNIEADNQAAVAAAMEGLHPAESGDVLAALNAEQRRALVRQLGDRFDFEALTEVDEAIRVGLMEEIPNADIARGVQELENDDAVFILEDLEEPDRAEILAALPTFERLSLKRSLDFPEDSAGRRMQTDFIAIPPFWSVGQTIDYMRTQPDLPDEFYQIYVVDPGYKLVGTIALDRFLRSSRPQSITDIMNTNIIEVAADEDQEEAARLFEQYDLLEAGVVDASRRLVGVLAIDDIVDVIHEEADEDFRRLAGVGDEAGPTRNPVSRSSKA